jgi:hypothetical protein
MDIAFPKTKPQEFVRLSFLDELGCIIIQHSNLQRKVTMTSEPESNVDGTVSQSGTTVTLGDHTFEYHVDLPVVGDYPVPAEFTRTPTGSSVYDPESILGESGRTYHGYKDGKYFLPNDAVIQISP